MNPTSRLPTIISLLSLSSQSTIHNSLLTSVIKVTNHRIHTNQRRMNLLSMLIIRTRSPTTIQVRLQRRRMIRTIIILTSLLLLFNANINTIKLMNQMHTHSQLTPLRSRIRQMTQQRRRTVQGHKTQSQRQLRNQASQRATRTLSTFRRITLSLSTSQHLNVNVRSPTNRHRTSNNTRKTLRRTTTLRILIRRINRIKNNQKITTLNIRVSIAMNSTLYQICHIIAFRTNSPSHKVTNTKRNLHHQ